MSGSTARQNENMKLIAEKNAAGAWREDWENIRGGFNPALFDDVDPATRQRLLAHQVGPPQMKGDKGLGVGDMLFTVGHWSDGGNYGTSLPYGVNTVRNESPEGRHGTNRGSVQQAAWEMGLANVGDKDQLNQFLDRADAVKANNPDFLKDGWTPEDIMLMREQPKQEVVQESAPVVADSVAVSETQPAVVEEARVVREPVEGVDYMSSEMQEAFDRIQAYNSGFSADKWIAETSKPDEQTEAQAQALADQYKFEIKKDLKPTAESTMNALTTAIPAIGTAFG